jgi:hypothetical protein
MTLDVGLHIPKGMGEPDEVEMFPDLKHVMVDGSLARDIIGGRRNFEIVLVVITNPADKRKLVPWFLDPAAQLIGLAGTPGSLTSLLVAGGGLDAGSTFLYRVASIDAVADGIAAAQVSETTDFARQTISLTWNPVTNNRVYKIFRKKDAEAWKVLDYTTALSYTDDGSIDPWIVESPRDAAAAIDYVQENTKMVATWLNGFRGSPQYSFRLNEATLMPNNVFPA